MTRPKVELHQAFTWTCESCGRDNFERGVTVAPESVDLDELPDTEETESIRMWIAEGGEGVFVVAPDWVTCGHCGERFETEDQP
jgi:hypothetical protein